MTFTEADEPDDGEDGEEEGVEPVWCGEIKISNPIKLKPPFPPRYRKRALIIYDSERFTINYPTITRTPAKRIPTHDTPIR